MDGSDRTETVRILHVDDEPDFADVAAQYLERQDDRFSARTATGASEAHDVLAEEEIDCIVSDYDMPGQNGIEFLDTVRDDHPDLPFILYTGKGSEEVASDAISAGATDYLQKETGTDQYELLANRIGNAVDQYRATRRAAELDRVRTLISDINQDLVRADSRAEIEARVCETISESDPYLFAWIGEVDPETDRIEPRASGGIDDWYLDTITVTADGTPTGQGPGGTAIRQRRVAVSQNVAEDPMFKPWRQEALEYGFRAVAGVPLEYENTRYGVLIVYADTTYAFDEDEQELLAELGDDIAHAIHSVEVREQLRTERDRRRALFENAPSPVIAGDVRAGGAEFRITEVNDAFKEVFGYDHEDVVGRDVAEVVVPEEGTDRHEQFREREMTGESITAEVERITTDGPREFLLHAIPFETDDEPADSWYAWYTDLTERKQQQRRLEAITKATQKDAIYLKDTEGRYQYVNDAGANVFNREPEDVIGKRAAELYDSVDEERLSEDLEVLETEEPITYEVSRTVDGEIHHFEAEKHPYYEDEELFGLVGISRDITKRVEQRRELQRERDRLDEFASIVAHDLRNPLNIAEGRLDMARVDCDSDHLDDVATALDRMEALIADVLTLAREGDRVSDVESVGLAGTAEGCWRNVETAGARLVTETAQTIRADHSRFKRLLENLFRNAVEHGGRDATVTVGDLPDGFYIEDDGPGIPEGEREQVFESGYSTSEGGSGFGLAIVREITEAHDWEINVTGSQDGGARFEITGVEVV